MYQLSEKQIDYILNDISARGVEMESLQQNLLDHVCCIIEQNLEAKGDFESFYQKTIKTFYKDALWEIEEETLSLLTFKNYYIMKKIMLISGTLSAFIILIGVIFKYMHWPGAALILPFGLLLTGFVFLPLLFTLRAKEKQNNKDRFVIVVGGLTAILLTVSIVFRIMHWPGADTLGTIFLALMFLVYIPLYFFIGIRNSETKVNTIVSSVIMIASCGLFLTMINLRPHVQERANLITNTNLQESYNALSKENNSIYSSLMEDSVMHNKKDLQDLITKCNALCNEIENVKLVLVNETADTRLTIMDYKAVTNGDNYDHPARVLFGDDQSAEPVLLTIKNNLNALNQLVSTNSQNKMPLVDVSDKTDPITNKAASWEVQNFYNLPLLSVLRNLTQLQVNLRFLELRFLK